MHAAVHGILPQEPEILPRAGPPENAEGLLLVGRYDDVDAPHFPGLCPVAAEDVVESAAATCQVSHPIGVPL